MCSCELREAGVPFFFHVRLVGRDPTDKTKVMDGYGGDRSALAPVDRRLALPFLLF